MYKNQLQELAQRSNYNLPSYACIREGPDHAPRFKATVNFNGGVFESPGFFSTLRQAEHAAAEVALNILSKQGPSQALAAKILDETGVCKNLLQETAQRAGVCLPNYNTVRSGPGHLPVFTCTVEVAGMTFSGEPAKTKKQAEKNAAMTAWTVLKNYASKQQRSSVTSKPVEYSDQEQISVAKALAAVKDMRDHVAVPGMTSLSGNRGSVSSPLFHRPSHTSTGPIQHTPPPVYVPHHVTTSWVPMDRREHRLTYEEAMYGTRFHNRVQADVVSTEYSVQNHSMSTSSHTFQHTKITVKPGMAYQPRFSRSHIQTPTESAILQPAMAYQPRPRSSPHAGVIGSGLTPSVRSSQLSDKPHRNEHEEDEDFWLRGESSTDSCNRQTSLETKADWSGTGHFWPNMGPVDLGSMMASEHKCIAPPVQVRSLVSVHTSRRAIVEEEDDDEVEAATRQVLSQLSL